MFARRVNAGLDIGEHAVKYAVVEPDTGKIKTLRHAELMPERASQTQQLPPDVHADRLKAVVADIQRGVGNAPRAVCTAVSSEGTICRYLELPPLSARELETAVPSAARKLIPFPLDQVVLSYVVVPQVAKGERRSAVFFVAVRKEEVERLTRLVQQCGLEVRALGVAPLAIARELSRNHPLPRDRFTGVLLIGFGRTLFLAMREQYPYYVREFTPAGRSFTYAFQMGNQSSWEAAEALKRNYDVGEQDISLEPFLLRWLDEVKRTVTHFREQFSQAEPELQRIYLSGGGAGWKGLAERVQETVKIPVTVDGWERLRWTGEQQRPGEACQYKLAVGVALEG